MSTGTESVSKPPLVAHVIFRFAVGGLENGLVNLINWMPDDRYRHAIISLTDSTDFRNRVKGRDVPIFELHKQPGHDLGVYTRMWQILRRLRPDIVHTRNLPALEFLAVAACAIRSGRIHGEHGRDLYDIDGSSRKYNLFRRLARPFVHRYTAVSADLADWLVGTVGVPLTRVHQIYNGVDVERFQPRRGLRQAFGPENFVHPGTLIVGTVGRMQGVKDQVTLVRAVLRLISMDPEARERLRLVLVGDGPLRQQSQDLLRQSGAEHLAWLPGEQEDVPRLMQGMDVFVLPSLGEGISNTILEAMACGLPVIATRVGGNPELVEEGETGMLVPPADPEALAQALRRYLQDGTLLRRHGAAGRKKVLASFSQTNMVEGYLKVYDSVIDRSRSLACQASFPPATADRPNDISASPSSRYASEPAGPIRDAAN